MRLAVGLALAVAGAGVGFADEAAIFVPMPLAARVEAGERSGLSIALEGRPGGALVFVTRTLRAFPVAPAYPLAGAASCGDPLALQVPASFALPPGLARLNGRSDSALGVVSRVVELVTRRITLDENDAGPQDASTVLVRGRGRCSGRANLAVGLLRAMGVPARVVQGMVFGTGGARWHRWGEAWLGPLGWTPFDPGAAVGVVSVRYLPIRGSGEGSRLAGVRLERLSERGYLCLPMRSGLRTVPVGGVRLHCLSPSEDREITALLLAPDGSRWARRGVQEVVFEGMLPGRYRLLVSGAGTSCTRDLELGGTHEVSIGPQSRGETGS
jgi:hypothetical protein